MDRNYLTNRPKALHKASFLTTFYSSFTACQALLNIFSSLKRKVLTNFVDNILLRDVIILSNETDLCTWLHELKHVRQFRDRSFGKFCVGYIKQGCPQNSRACPLEAEAYTWSVL